MVARRWLTESPCMGHATRSSPGSRARFGAGRSLARRRKIVNGHRDAPRGTAEISSCGHYRHELTRRLDDDNPRTLVVVGLNPSTATADEDDATIRKEMKFASRWNCGLLLKVNAYDFRATKPRAMFQAAKDGIAISSPVNDDFIRRAVSRVANGSGIVLVAWGRHIQPERQAALADIIGEHAMCLGTNKDGSPAHPLYQRDDAVPSSWPRHAAETSRCQPR